MADFIRRRILEGLFTQFTKEFWSLPIGFKTPFAAFIQTVKMGKLRIRRSLSAPPGAPPSCGVCHTERGTQSAGVSLCSHGKLCLFCFLVLFLWLCLPISAVAMWHPFVSLSNARTLHKHLCKGFWISSSCVLSKGWSLWRLWGQGMDLVRFHKGRGAHIILLEHQAPCQNRAALSSLSQLLLWMLILHVFLCLYTYISVYICVYLCISIYLSNVHHTGLSSEVSLSWYNVFQWVVW